MQGHHLERVKRDCPRRTYVPTPTSRYTQKPLFGTAPALTVTDVGDCVRLELAGIARGEGDSLQEAADELVRSVLRLAGAVRSTGFRVTPELAADVGLLDYLHQLGELAATGEDVRRRLFA